MITAENITDEQIRELLRDLSRDVSTARFALLGHPDTADTIALRDELSKARARCAAIINARAIPAAHGCAYGIPKADCAACDKEKGGAK